MRAVWYTRQGPAREVLTLGDRPDPVPAPGEALVRLRASGVNPADVGRRGGSSYVMHEPLVIPNSDGAGLVEAVGEGVDPALIGRRVWLYNGQRGRDFGTAAELISLDHTLLSPLPDDLTFAEGACLGIPAMTAWCCVMGDAPVAGTTVLVTGGGGAVGNYAIQFARRAGARVLTTVTTDLHEADASRAGAHEVLHRDRADLAEAILALTDGAGVDRIVEVEFGANLPVTDKVIAPRGVIAAYASRGAPTPALPFSSLMRRNITLRMVLLPQTPLEMRRRAQADMTQWLASGEGFHRVAGTWPLAETWAAHEAVEAGGKRGTAVVEPHL